MYLVPRSIDGGFLPKLRPSSSAFGCVEKSNSFYFFSRLESFNLKGFFTNIKRNHGSDNIEQILLPRISLQIMKKSSLPDEEKEIVK